MDDFKTIEALAKGAVKGALEKYSETIAENGKKVFAKLEVVLGKAFNSYLEKSYEKYSNIKTLLYKEKPQKLRDFFVTPRLRKGYDEGAQVVSALNSTVVRNFSGQKFIIVQGTGGIGKSMLMKHLFLSELETCREFIPVLFELKDINRQANDYNLMDAIFEGMNILAESTSKHAIEYALELGMFMILLDGFDEINGNKSKTFTEKLNDFCDKYPDNNVIMSSRKIDDFISFEKFAVMNTMPMDKSQAISLIEKLDYHAEPKQRFIKALDDELFENHEEFASNPLLLTMMFLTYDAGGKIQETPHLFYENAFETLLERHDSTKEGYTRKIESGLRSDLFKKVFATFCCITYHNSKFSFSKDELINTLNKVKTAVAKDGIDFDVENYITDLTNAVCMLYREGFTYHFTHRSFQEYFTAVYLKEQTDDIMEKRGLAIIKTDMDRAVIDNVFRMLCDMAKDKFEKNILLPFLIEIEKDFEGDDIWEFYFKRMVASVCFIDGDLIPTFCSNDATYKYFFLRHHLENAALLSPPTDTDAADEAVRQHLNDDGTGMLYILTRDSRHMEEGRYVHDDKTLYKLLRATRIGQNILAISKAREALTEKYKNIPPNDEFFSV
ncbi:MAG: NACHT domain-containing protein [Defluviitaleaceae bacterium]|nr:NACHT domain-containing protein [Defluviitaleaceae bacterium]MCL2263005.1 NACHT domain-containing protein [Defluviitaleaceae bacterium]